MSTSQFLNFVVDWFSLESQDTITKNMKFLEEINDYCDGVDSKHCIKSDMYKLIGGSRTSTLGKYSIYYCVLLHAGMSKDLLAPKEFASDKKV